MYIFFLVTNPKSEEILRNSLWAKPIILLPLLTSYSVSITYKQWIGLDVLVKIGLDLQKEIALY